MKNKTPRGKMPSLIGSTLGKPRRVSVERTCECKRCGGQIETGKECIAIPQLGGSFQNLKRYCDACYQAIVKKTQTDLDNLKEL